MISIPRISATELRIDPIVSSRLAAGGRHFRLLSGTGAEHLENFA